MVVEMLSSFVDDWRPGFHTSLSQLQPRSTLLARKYKESGCLSLCDVTAAEEEHSYLHSEVSLELVCNYPLLLLLFGIQ